jgi:uncharacterized protein with HEPN domain
MQPKAPKWLDDIRRSAEFIVAETRARTEAEYRADPVLRAAVERHFEIIGEAMGRLSRDDPATVQQIADHRRIVAFRNLLIHGYDLVDHAEVWNIVTRHLPRLLEQVRSLLGEADRGDP